MLPRKAFLAVVGCLWLVGSSLGGTEKAPSTLKYGDGKADGKKSLGGSGEMITFSLPSSKQKLEGIRIHGSRYGYPKAPDEDFLIYILSEDMSEIIHTERAPYSLFERGENKWGKVKFKKPREVPTTFWVVLDFRAQQTKGVYVSYDTSTAGKHSKIGLPGQDIKDVDFGGDWMIQADLAK
jgi:RNA polymerase sigma-70 factor (ECF subfamily)